MQLEDVFRDFARRGLIMQRDLDKILGKIRKCPYDGRQFIPQSHNQKFCSYDCRSNSYSELRTLQYRKEMRRRRK